MLFRSKCDCCGIESPVEQAFCPIARVFKSPLRYCPTCANQRQSRILKRCHLFCVATAAVSIIGAVTVVPPEERARLLFGAFILLFLDLGAVWHELGHALVATVVGLCVFRVSFGLFGRTVFKRQAFGIDIQAKSIPFGGFTLVAPQSLSWLHLRWSLFVAAGPLADRKSTRLNSSHSRASRMPSSA